MSHDPSCIFCKIAAGQIPSRKVYEDDELIAFFLDMWKRDEARGSWQESHFSWRIRSVLWAGGLYLVTAPLWLLFLIPGWIAWAIISIWFLYRIARGWLNLSSNTPMPMPA